MKRNLLFIIALFFCALSFGQGEIDAYRYSNDDLSGTARGQAMGGAFGALGGDVTGVAINPAGIGIYRSSEITANMSLKSPIINGTTNQESNTTFHFDNISFVGYYPFVKGSMLSLNFGFNYNRIKSFDQRYRTSSRMTSSSMTDYMALLTNGIQQSAFNVDPYNNSYYAPWLSVLAWDGGLINLQKNATDAYESILGEGDQVSPSLYVSEKGTVDAYDFTIGSNIANQFYWGATVTLINLSYQMTSSYNEDFSGGDGFYLDNYLKTDGSGFQMKVGVIYKPIDALRLGVAYHSPVWYSMTDYYKGWITPIGIINMTDGKQFGPTSTPGDNPNDPDSPASTNYYLRTPGSWTFSAATVLGTQAIISLDYELKGYAAMNLSDADGYGWKDNTWIKEDYKNTSTIRAGFEYRFTPQLSGRLGYAWAQNPYSDNIQSVIGDRIEPAGTIPHYTLSGDANYLTAGVGFKFTPQFYGDFALVYRTQKDYLYYYPPINSKDVVSDSFAGDFTNQSLKGLITLGYKF